MSARPGSLELKKFYRIWVVTLADPKTGLHADLTQFLKIAQDRAFGDAKVAAQLL